MFSLAVFHPKNRTKLLLFYGLCKLILTKKGYNLVCILSFFSVLTTYAEMLFFILSVRAEFVVN